MFSLVHAAFWTAAFASSLMGIALIIPNWLGRYNEDSSFELHGVFYQFECGRGRCETFGRWLDSDIAPLEGKTWGIEIAALPALALSSFLLCFIAISILEILSCRCCGGRPRMWRIILAVTSLLLASALFAVVTLLLAIYVCSEFYSSNKVDRAEEFPWSVLLFAIATVLVIMSVVFYIMILCNWDRYRHKYGFFDNLNDGDVLDSRQVWYDRPHSLDRPPRGRAPYRIDTDGYSDRSTRDGSPARLNKNMDIHRVYSSSSLPGMHNFGYRNDSSSRLEKAMHIDRLSNSKSSSRLELLDRKPMHIDRLSNSKSTSRLELLDIKPDLPSRSRSLSRIDNGNSNDFHRESSFTNLQDLDKSSSFYFDSLIRAKKTGSVPSVSGRSIQDSPTLHRHRRDMIMMSDMPRSSSNL